MSGAAALAFPPAARLRSAADFAGLRACRKPLRGRCFIIRHVAGHTAGPRLGMAVSRRTSKRAVVRNRIKRVVRESFRHARAELPLLDLLVIALPPAATASPADLRTELATHWRRLQQLHGAPQTRA